MPVKEGRDRVRSRERVRNSRGEVEVGIHEVDVVLYITSTREELLIDRKIRVPRFAGIGSLSEYRLSKFVCRIAHF
jgi:hypothetical protein